MHPALLGLLVGLGAAAFFILSEYTLLKKSVNERAKRQGRREGEFSGIERERMKAIIRFSLILPPALSLGFWIVLPRLGL